MCDVCPPSITVIANNAITKRSSSSPLIHSSHSFPCRIINSSFLPHPLLAFLILMQHLLFFLSYTLSHPVTLTLILIPGDRNGLHPCYFLTCCQILKKEGGLTFTAGGETREATA